MILDEYIEITLNGANLRYYENLGYEIPRKKDKWGKLRVPKGTKIIIKTSDLQKKSNVKIRVSCDNCNKEIIVSNDNYTKAIDRFGEYFCQKCNRIHCKKTNLEKYGVEYHTQLEETKRKIRETNLKKYGVENAFELDKSIVKRKNTCMKNYGSEYPFLSQKYWDETKEKLQKEYGVDNYANLPSVREKTTQSYYKNNSQKTSFQQQYIYELINSKYNTELNYALDYYSLDVFLLDYNVDIEVDGGGHDLPVKTGKLTKDEFKQREIIRENIIKRNGIKIVRFIMPTDKLPSDDKILELVDNAINYFNTTDHTWVNYYIEENKFRNAENQDGSYLDYGDLRDSYKLKKQIEKEAA